MHRGIEIRVTASLGVAARTDEETDLNAIIREADQALYRAKAAGRNRVETADRRAP
jgi:diguanylate cyclase (GGDEF)-like protein